MQHSVSPTEQTCLNEPTESHVFELLDVILLLFLLHKCQHHYDYIYSGISSGILTATKHGQVEIVSDAASTTTMQSCKHSSQNCSIITSVLSISVSLHASIRQAQTKPCPTGLHYPESALTIFTQFNAIYIKCQHTIVP